MSAYIPKHSRAKKEPGLGDTPKPGLPDSALGAEPSQESALAHESAPLHKPAAGPATEDPLSEAILDAYKAVREHPELANPFLVTEGIPEEASSTALAKINKRRWPVIIAIIITMIVIAGATTYYVLSSQALQRESQRTAGYETIDEAIALIQESDQVVVALDSATVTEVTEDNLSERKVLLERVPTTLETLEAAEQEARSALDQMTSEEDKEFVEHVIDAAVNRKDMLTSGEEIIKKDIEAMNAALIFGQAWELIINADTELRETTELSRTGNYYDLNEAIERNWAVVANLDQAAALITQAKETFPDADFAVVSEYLSLKYESVHLAIEADQAVIDGDIEAVNTKNAEFSLKDGAVVEAANRIPINPLSLITDAYESSTKEQRALYDSARANAADADGYIREYVGVETQTGVQ